MRADVKWTNLSRRQISRRLAELGTPASKRVVSDLLWEQGYRRRKAQKKKTMGQHADRNAQFEKIARLKQKFLDAGQPFRACQKSCVSCLEGVISLGVKERI